MIRVITSTIHGERVRCSREFKCKKDLRNWIRTNENVLILHENIWHRPITNSAIKSLLTMMHIYK